MGRDPSAGNGLLPVWFSDRGLHRSYERGRVAGSNKEHDLLSIPNLQLIQHFLRYTQTSALTDSGHHRLAIARRHRQREAVLSYKDMLSVP